MRQILGTITIHSSNKITQPIFSDRMNIPKALLLLLYYYPPNIIQSTTFFSKAIAWKLPLYFGSLSLLFCHVAIVWLSEMVRYDPSSVFIVSSPATIIVIRHTVRMMAVMSVDPYSTEWDSTLIDDGARCQCAYDIISNHVPRPMGARRGRKKCFTTTLLGVQ